MKVGDAALMRAIAVVESYGLKVEGVPAEERVCVLPGCGKKFIAFTKYRGGPRKRYCCTDHQLAGELLGRRARRRRQRAESKLNAQRRA